MLSQAVLKLDIDYILLEQEEIRYIGSAEHPDDIERLQQLAEEIKLCLECGRLKMRPLFGPEQFTQPAIDRGKHEDFEDVGIKTLREKGRYNRGITASKRHR